jgi:hypothetical protein
VQGRDLNPQLPVKIFYEKDIPKPSILEMIKALTFLPRIVFLYFEGGIVFLCFQPHKPGNNNMN